MGTHLLRGRCLRVTKLRIRCADADYEVGYILSQGHFGNYTVFFGLINIDKPEDRVGFDLKIAAKDINWKSFDASQLKIEVGQKGVFRVKVSEDEAE